mmetsp:Transcript_124344/g.398166  ORF Transcript_124344/g.398166 Transcript_124344/m.398166 type:complete len:206 (-) Transcript_124344:220-837(-)
MYRQRLPQPPAAALRGTQQRGVPFFKGRALEQVGVLPSMSDVGASRERAVPVPRLGSAAASMRVRYGNQPLRLRLGSTVLVRGWLRLRLHPGGLQRSEYALAEILLLVREQAQVVMQNYDRHPVRRGGRPPSKSGCNLSAALCWCGQESTFQCGRVTSRHIRAMAQGHVAQDVVLLTQRLRQERCSHVRDKCGCTRQNKKKPRVE